jgi:cytochrome c oxidase subunit III
MWLFLASDSLTFGALLFAFSYNRIYTAWPTPFGKDSIINATVMTACLLSSSLTMVLGVFAAQRRRPESWTRNWLLATMAFGTAFIVLHGMEWTKLISEGLRCRAFRSRRGAGRRRVRQDFTGVPQFAATFFGLTAMHMLHVTIGVIYLGVVALRKWFLPILGVMWLAGYFLIPSDNVFHYGIHALLIGLIVASIIFS